MESPVPTGDTCPVSMSSAAPGTAQPLNGSSSGRKYSYGHFGGSGENCSNAAYREVSSLFLSVLNPTSLLVVQHTMPGLSTGHTAQAEHGSLETREEEEASKFCCSPHCLPAPAQEGQESLFMSLSHCVWTEHPVIVTVVLGVILTSFNQAGAQQSPHSTPLLHHTAHTTHPLPG